MLRIREDPPWLLHFELQSSRDPDFVARLPAYNILLERRHGLRVRTVAVLMRRAADAPDLTGEHQREFPGEPPYLVFRYRVVRLWELPPETFLQCGLGIVPLAPLGAVTEADLPALIGRMEQRISQEAPPGEMGAIWTASGVLMGMRYPATLIKQLLQGVHGMKDSTFFQAIVEEGAVTEARKFVFSLGRKRFGPPTPQQEAELSAVVDLRRLERMGDRLLDVATWEELLETR